MIFTGTQVSFEYGPAKADEKTLSVEYFMRVSIKRFSLLLNFAFALKLAPGFFIPIITFRTEAQPELLSHSFEKQEYHQRNKKQNSSWILFHLPADTTFFAMIRSFIFPCKVFTHRAEIC